MFLQSAASNQRKQLDETYAIKKNKLQRQHKQMKAGYRGVVAFTLFYSIITTFLMAIKTEVIGMISKLLLMQLLAQYRHYFHGV